MISCSWVSNGEGLQGLQAEFGRVALVDTSAVVIPDNVSSEKVDTSILFAPEILSSAFIPDRVAHISSKQALQA